LGVAINRLFECSEFSVQEGEDDVNLKGYIEPSVYRSYGSRYKECILMVNGLEKSTGETPVRQKYGGLTAQEDHP
jgi:hypothetical protein